MRKLSAKIRMYDARWTGKLGNGSICRGNVQFELKR